ncbi:MAG TPA: zinc ribbon domain-containing protein, partial [Gemmataceae bacterium]
MAIKFKCPHCGESYLTKDELAGKRVTCKRQTCRKVFAVPDLKPSPNGAAAGAPAGDADKLAASLLAEEAPTPEQQAAAAGKPIKVRCTNCDHEWEVERSKEGKNVICPECTTRVRVPLQKEAKPKDWRANARRPSLAKVEGPDDAWTTAAATLVGAGTLRDAGALLEEVEPVPVATRVKQVLLVGALVGAVVLGVMWLMRARTEGEHTSAMADAITALEEADKQSKLPAIWTAAIRRAAAEHDLRLARENPDLLAEAHQHFTTARGALSRAPAAYDRGLMIARLACTLVGFGGAPEDVAAGRRWDWDRVQEELRRTLQRTQTNDPEVWRYAFEQLAAELAPTGEGPRAATVAQGVGVPQAPDIVARIGVRLFRAGKSEQARAMLERARALAGPEVEGKAAFVSPALHALAMAVEGDQAKPAVPPLPPPGGGEPAPETRLGYAWGLVLQGKADEAKEMADRKGRPDARLRALLTVADVLLDKDPAAAGPVLGAADEILHKDLKKA